MLGRITDDTRIIDLTVGELRALLRSEKVEQHEYVYGLDGVCDVLKMGKTKACRLNKSGAFDIAKIRGGRRPVFVKDILIGLKF